MSKHTPGPWNKRKRGTEYHILGPIEAGQHAPRLVAVIDAYDNTATANARLIEAAPLVSEALEALRDYVWGLSLDDDAETERELVEMADAALAKAKGKS